MFKPWAVKICAVGFGLGTAGCATGGMGGGGAPSLSASAVPEAPASAPAAAPVSKGGFLEGPVGSRLAEADRQAAFQAETDAVSTGERKTWRGSKGVYGFILPGPQAATAEGPGACRTFTHTIYFGGRPQVGHGTGCQNPDGTWRISA